MFVHSNVDFHAFSYAESLGASRLVAMLAQDSEECMTVHVAFCTPHPSIYDSLQLALSLLMSSSGQFGIGLAS
jgi:hypothetical protein